MIEPSLGLLMSIAMRMDHALGCPGYYDNLGAFSTSTVTHEQRLLSVLSDARRAYEEISGNGFYSPEKEEYYLEILKKSLPNTDLDEIL